LRAGQPGIAQRGAFRCPTQQSIRSPSRENFAALAAVGAWLQALDYTGFDYTLDRIEGLERELARLKEELRQSREASSSDGHPCACRKLDPGVSVVESA
jgi:hypothetical protein